jgi:hypothetical protein
MTFSTGFLNRQGKTVVVLRDCAERHAGARRLRACVQRAWRRWRAVRGSDGCEPSARGDGDVCAKRVWARSAYPCCGCPGSGAARVAAVPQRSGPQGLARVRERAGAEEVRSGAQRRRHAVEIWEAGTRALLYDARASTRGFGGALARLRGGLGWRWGARRASIAAEHASTALRGGRGTPVEYGRQRRFASRDATVAL